MKLSPALLPSVLSVIFATPVASLFDCSHIQIDGQKFDFSPLTGPHSVVTTIQHESWEWKNTTYTLDLCRALEKKAGGGESKSCPNGSRVCAITRAKGKDEDDISFIDARPLAGDLANHGGTHDGLDAHYARLKTSDSTADSKKVGVRLVMNGARWPMDRSGITTHTIIEMQCSELAGTEGEVDPNGDFLNPDETGDKAGDPSRRLRRADGEDGNKDGDSDDESDGLPEHQLLKLPKNETALIFDSFDHQLEKEKVVDILRLTWYTKLACEDNDQRGGEGSGGNSSEHWGFFTWVIILVFMGTAAYLIFGSWLNYNRYGARGWDLLPHGDTIRDVPYLLKDWTRRVMNTVQGTGSRGGYAAV